MPMGSPEWIVSRDSFLQSSDLQPIVCSTSHIQLEDTVYSSTSPTMLGDSFYSASSTKSEGVVYPARYTKMDDFSTAASGCRATDQRVTPNISLNY